jgi:ABC-type lipoprotein export system ATPase subunit
LAKWVKPTQGEVLWEDITSVGWVFQNPVGVARRTVIDHTCLPLIATGASRDEAEQIGLEILGRFGLAKQAFQVFSTLSGGEAQRLMLARAMAKNPSLLLVDEPTAQLDRLAADTVNSVLGELKARDMIVVVATHDPQTRKACHRSVDLGSRDLVTTIHTPPPGSPIGWDLGTRRRWRIRQ